MTRAGPPKNVDPAEVARLAREGMGRNAVARHLQVSRRAVDTAAQAAGIAWDRTATAAATAARLADTRAELADTFATTADLATDRLITELQADVLDTAALRALGTVAGISADKLISLENRVSDADHGSPDSLLDQLRQGVDDWHASLNDQTITVTEHNTTGETQ